MEKEKKEWKNHKGEMVPAKLISRYDKKKEKLIQKVVKEAEKTSAKLAGLKKQMFEGLDEIELEMYKHYKMVKPSDAKGGNTFHSFDKSVRLKMQVNDVIEFSDQIKLAKEKIDEFKVFQQNLRADEQELTRT